MTVEIYKRGTTPDEWAVEFVNSADDGGIDLTLFSGPLAEKRAREYAKWKYQV